MTEPVQIRGTTTVAQIVEIMEQIAPPVLSEAWDNTGLLLGDAASPVDRVMTCLTLTDLSVQEAVTGGAQMVITHHPLPFKPLAKITTQSAAGRQLWELARHAVSIYSPHTSWDSAMDGINAQLARKLSLIDIESLIPSPHHELGAGRYGDLAKPLDLNGVAHKLSHSVPHCRLRAVPVAGPITRIGIGCGSGGSFLSAAADRGCQLLVTGEATFHACLEAQGLGIGMLMLGHFASEKFAMDQLASRLASALPEVHFWGSRQEADPVVPL